MRGLGSNSCFLVKHFQFERILVLLESLPWLYLGGSFGHEGRQFYVVEAKIMGQSMERTSPKRPFDL